MLDGCEECQPDIHIVPAASQPGGKPVRKAARKRRGSNEAFFPRATLLFKVSWHMLLLIKDWGSDDRGSLGTSVYDFNFLDLCMSVSV